MPTPAELRAARARFARARRVETWYGAALRGIARQIGQLARGFDVEDEQAVSQLERLLEQYAVTIEPWAASVGRRMLEDVAARDARAWFQAGREIGRNLRAEIHSAPTGAVMRAALAEQVRLIKSLPIEAAQRVHHLALEATVTGRRARDIADEIMASWSVSLSRANTIARTEVSRVAGELTAARGQHIGSEGYIWRTAKDKDVRRLHRPLEGKFFKWGEPPVTGERGERSLPGGIYNCRCYPEPVIPDIFLAA